MGMILRINNDNKIKKEQKQQQKKNIKMIINWYEESYIKSNKTDITNNYIIKELV